VKKLIAHIEEHTSKREPDVAKNQGRVDSAAATSSEEAK
jgi:hypothetical protein